MAKKTNVDERIDTLFAGFQPEEHISNSERISKADTITAPLADPKPVRQNAGETTSSKSARGKLIFLIGPVAVCLLAAFFTLVRFKTAYTSSSFEQLIPVLPFSTPYIQDAQPPTVPGGLVATTVDTKTVNLTWIGSTDNIEVVGYTIYRNGVSIGTALGSNLVFSDLMTAPDTTYDYALDAYDQAGNHSAISAPLQVTTSAGPGSLTFLLPVADTYVNADSPMSVYGTANTLRVDASPDVHTYLRFNVTGLGGKTISQAHLKLYTNSSAAWGIRVAAVADGTWNELATNYNNAPILGNQLAFSPVLDTASWITIDVTPYITGEGSFNFGIATDSTTAISLASREAGSNAPQLILDLH